jgi:hypothetical protein
MRRPALLLGPALGVRTVEISNFGTWNLEPGTLNVETLKP